MAKYDPLRGFLLAADESECNLTFLEIEAIIGSPLPESARKYRTWWGNQADPKRAHCRAWMDAGWEVAPGGPNLMMGEVTFVRRL